ncbi:MAG: response regulator transcription factor [Actinomycetota bacterium]|nr:MAG: response regulator transcription factor [Actinomycetota bacterium]
MRILIIEDEKRLADSIKKGLEQESYAVDVSYEGTDGFGMAVIQDYDLIILDLMLPGMDGMEICRKLRTEENILYPILMLTARGQIEDRVRGLNCGADDYLTKPFAFEELLARIKALSRRPRNSLGTVLSIDDLTLDTISYEVRRAGRLVVLSKTEYGLLEFLLKNRGRVLSKNQIIENVWDYDADVLPNTVEVYIRYLRNKIEKPFRDKKPLIETIRGFGYRIGVSPDV